MRIPLFFAALSLIAVPMLPLPALGEDLRVMLCAELPYRSCVHNGDLIYLNGKPYRLADVATPDRYLAPCPKASNIAWYAAIRLRDLINEGPFDFAEEAGGAEPMVRLSRDGVSLGDALIAKGLARPRTAQAPDWCAAD